MIFLTWPGGLPPFPFPLLVFGVPIGTPGFVGVDAGALLACGIAAGVDIVPGFDDELGIGEDIVPVLIGSGEGCVVCANAALDDARANAAAASISRLDWCMDDGSCVCW